MQYANVLVELGGDSGTTVPKMNVSVAEIAVLRAIHGEAAVTEIEPCDPEGDKPVLNRQERSRLLELYGAARDGNNNSIVEMLFPGVAARVFEDLDELGIPEEFFKAERMKPKAAKPTAKPKKAAKADDSGVAETIAETTAETTEDDGGELDDGIDDMPDKNIFK